MNTLEENTSCNLSEMPPNEKNSETSRLVGSSAASRPSYINLFSNICALVLTAIITFCSFVNGVSLFSFHPILMTLGWMIFMTSAINAITPGDLATEWMPIRLRSARHWVIQLLGGVIIAIGFFVILSNKIINDKPHFQSLHSKFGLSSLIFVLVTMLGGLGALYSLKLKHYLAPIYIKLLHTSVGLTTFCLGVISICLGLYSTWFTFGDILRYCSLILVLIIMVATVLRPILKVYFRLRERLENMN